MRIIYNRFLMVRLVHIAKNVKKNQEGRKLVREIYNFRKSVKYCNRIHRFICRIKFVIITLSINLHNNCKMDILSKLSDHIKCAEPTSRVTVETPHTWFYEAKRTLVHNTKQGKLYGIFT